jgi:polyferredoxin
VESQEEFISKKTKTILVRRRSPDRSQRVRHTVQWLFVALNAWIGVQFYLWVRYYERGGVGLYVPRPAGVEGWLPIAGLMNSKYLLSTGRVPMVHPAAMYLFLGFLLMSVLLKKVFCSWLCPVGTFSETLWKIGQRIFKRSFHLPQWLDVPLRAIKYLLLAFFAWIIGGMSAEARKYILKATHRSGSAGRG